MANIIWNLFCKSVIVDEKSKNMTLIEVLENVQFNASQPIEEGKKWITIPYEVNLVTMFERTELNTPEEITIRLTVKTESNEIFEQAPEMKISLIENDRNKTVMNLNSLPFLKSGRHNFITETLIDDKWIEIYRTPLYIYQEITTAQ